MTIDIASLTPRELQIYAAGYLEAVADKNTELEQADRYIAQLARELTQANDDADRYYRHAFNPRPPMQPAISLAERERQRDALCVARATTTITDWADVETRRPAAA